jgi:hypothetical protein
VTRQGGVHLIWEAGTTRTTNQCSPSEGTADQDVARLQLAAAIDSGEVSRPRIPLTPSVDRVFVSGKAC